MVDKYRIDLRVEIEDPDALWKAFGQVLTAVRRADPRTFVPPKGYEHIGDELSLSDRGRSWRRDSLNEIKKLVREQGLAEYVVHWTFYGTDLQWRIDARVWQFPNRIEISAYAGRDRLRTEAIVRDVVNSLARRGVKLDQGETEVSSSDDPLDEEKQPLAPRKKRSWVQWLIESIKKHTGGYVIGVVASLTATGLGFLIWRQN